MARNIRTEFDWALERAHLGEGPKPDCLGHPDEFVDYHTLPTAEEAELLCERCPLLALCAADANRRRPAWGIRGGKVYVNGRRAHAKPRGT